jgi:hypothetical protein
VLEFDVDGDAAGRIEPTMRRPGRMKWSTPRGKVRAICVAFAATTGSKASTTYLPLKIVASLAERHWPPQIQACASGSTRSRCCRSASSSCGNHGLSRQVTNSTRALSGASHVLRNMAAFARRLLRFALHHLDGIHRVLWRHETRSDKQHQQTTNSRHTSSPGVLESDLDDNCQPDYGTSSEQK